MIYFVFSKDNTCPACANSYAWKYDVNLISALFQIITDAYKSMQKKASTWKLKCVLPKKQLFKKSGI